MQKSRIEWTDYTLNPIKGMCPVDCKDNQGKSYCYARAMYKRFKWNPEIRFEPEVFEPLFELSESSRIFVGSTIELFDSWVPAEWMAIILTDCKILNQHIFMFLTKRPQNLRFWAFPPNVWVGVSATNEMMAAAGIAWLSKVEASVKFLSLEPLLSWDSENANNSIIRWHPEYLNWVIIGQQTPVRLKTMPKIGWIEEIIRSSDTAGIPVFLKDNLIPCVDQYEIALKDGKYRQEFPEVRL